jgi:hypothetical protein
MIYVRNLREKETLPKELHGHFPEGWRFDASWAWVAVKEKKIVGFLLGAPCHGAVIMSMLQVTDGRAIRKLLRAFCCDSLARGYLGYMVYVNQENSEQVKLLNIAKKAGAVEFPHQMTCFCGRLADAANWGKNPEGARKEVKEIYEQHLALEEAACV